MQPMMWSSCSMPITQLWPPSTALPKAPYGALGWSVLYAILNGAREVGVAPTDIDGTLRITGQGVATLVLFDAVPGGAGHAIHISRHLPQTFRAAYDLVANCECGPETSCYSCLRSYNNQQHHDEMVRGLARRCWARCSASTLARSAMMERLRR